MRGIEGIRSEEESEPVSLLSKTWRSKKKKRAVASVRKTDDRGKWIRSPTRWLPSGVRTSTLIEILSRGGSRRGFVVISCLGYDTSSLPMDRK